MTVGLNCLFQMIMRFSLNFQPIHSSRMAGNSRQFKDEGHSKIYAQYRLLPPESLVWQDIRAGSVCWVWLRFVKNPTLDCPS